ncbi:hypothetical protein ANO11243_079450 [Dothideomycetidae sp. 11243]|nr:hypothetical protein ANO11243_079450 [fungal sp. No.11243]
MPAKGRNSLLEQLADLEDPVPRDFDPEDERPRASGSDGDSDISDNDEGAAARDHYAPVGKSKLRKPEQQILGPQYAGSRVSRTAALDGDAESEEDDPFAKGFDGEDSDEDSMGDAETGSEDRQEDSSEDLANDIDVSDDDSASEDDSEGIAGLDQDVRPAAVKISGKLASTVNKTMAQQQGLVAATLSQAAQQDVAKGIAVQKQRAAFDALLGVRIKLQKALIGGNTLAGLAQDGSHPEEDLENAFQAAETAAFNLWSSLTSLREQLGSARSGQKRNHAEFSSDMPTSDLWRHTKSQEAESKRHVDSTLEKWYSRTHAAETTSAARNRVNTASAASSTSSAANIINSALADRTHLLKRARTPRSCAPYQLSRQSTSAKHQPSDPTVYDDADMYAVLLTTLLEQRGNATTVALDKGGAALSGHAVRREAKTRRVVDTKASKGRKLRYTVHEKLLNYMAPRETGSWGDRQAEELFSSLFGRRVALEEEEVEDIHVDGEEETNLDGEEAGLLFGR